MNYEFPLVNPPAFVEFIGKTKVMQKKLMSSIDLDISIISTHSLLRESNNYVYVEEKCLVRHQFLEIIIRLAREQYVRKGICSGLG